ncbi:MBL fold metallo-hydrolase [Pollutimonas nitritireducens]|uniref:MBL fold metallo-hydrolase n=1 Tax=Pollutimonas nitritireducens TaxID=2045209 RepID=A0A2N4UEN3_9BURK|nr:MBL fold metallo-hydrolase [Pollutimonas nitritireducens]PLC53467.1 MBL fold metallo-hydrolase [Pollutimonas nitritireducens]
MAYVLQGGLAALVACIALGFVPATADETPLELKPIQVSPHVYYFGGESSMASAANKGFMSNAGFVVTDDGVVAFDALGTPALGEAMLAAIRKVTDQPVKRVVVSHYHADHIYGLQVLRAAGADIWAHTKGQGYLHSDIARERLEQRRTDLRPWVDENTKLVPADRWLDFKDGKTISFTLGNMHFQIIDVSGAHSDDDIMMYVEEDKVLLAGDLYFTGRIPFVGDADSKAWLVALDSMLDVDPEVVIPGHGASSTNTREDMALTRDYLEYLRKEMGAAVEDMTGFEEAYATTDWGQFESYPAFDDANRINAYGQYLVMERESLEGK